MSSSLSKFSSPSSHQLFSPSSPRAAGPPVSPTVEGGTIGKLLAIVDNLGNNATLPCIVCDIDGRTVWWSKSISTAFGYDEEYRAGEGRELGVARPNFGDSHLSAQAIAQFSLVDAPVLVEKTRRDGRVLSVIQKVARIRAGLSGGPRPVGDNGKKRSATAVEGYLVTMVDVTDAVDQANAATDAVSFVQPQYMDLVPVTVDLPDSDRRPNTLERSPSRDSSKSGDSFSDESSIFAPALDRLYHGTYNISGNNYLKEVVRLLCLELGARLAFVGFYVADPHVSSNTVDLISSVTAPQGFSSLVSGLRRDDKQRVAAEEVKHDVAGFQLNAFTEGEGFLALGPTRQVSLAFIELLKKQEASVFDLEHSPAIPNLDEFVHPGDRCCVMGLHNIDSVIGGIGIVFDGRSAPHSLETLQTMLEMIAPRVAHEVGTLAQTERLTREKGAAERATKSKSHFLANMSHEIRTPVSAIIGLTDMILWDNIQLSEENRSRLELINSSGEHLLSVINGVLDLSKIGDEDVQFKLKQDPMKLKKCIKQAVHLAALSPAASKKQIQIANVHLADHPEILENQAPDSAVLFTWSLADDVPEIIVGDVTRIRQVVLNMLTNALKFTDRGSVTLRIERAGHEDHAKTFEGEHHPVMTTPKETIHNSHSYLTLPTPPDSRRSSDTLSTSDCSDSDTDTPKTVSLLFTISDTGCGIPREKINRLFNPYCQIDNRNNRDSAVGTGLGLAISQQLVNSMGGQIWVESSANEGSRFSVRIPFETVETISDTSSQDERTSNSDSDGGRASPEFKTATVPKRTARKVEALKPLLENIVKHASLDIEKKEAALNGKSGTEIGRNETKSSVTWGTGKGPPTLSPRPGATRSLSKEQHTKNMGKTQAADISALYPLRILVAEDNPINQQIALSLLRKMGYAADLAEDGLQVLEKAEHTHYDLILMDLSMPNMGGIEAMHELRKRWEDVKTDADHPEHRRPPVVIALTASGTPEDFERCREAGMHDWLNKPFRSLELQAKISEHFAHLLTTPPVSREASEDGQQQ
ncbi:hypothetical protein HKX48_007666 [Thoreauomyces humboldtii]|nr:hypothetical protein HKX48_007666 [Thoreauomyces humboldtii]